MENSMCNATETVQEPLESIASKAEEAVQEPLESIASKVEEAVQEPLESVASKAEVAVEEPLESVASKAEEAVQGPLESVASKAEESVQEPLESVASKAEEAVQEPLESVASKAEEAVQEPLESVASIAEEAVQEPLESVASKAEEVVEEPLESVVSKAEETVHENSDSVKITQDFERNECDLQSASPSPDSNCNLSDDSQTDKSITCSTLFNKPNSHASHEKPSVRVRSFKRIKMNNRVVDFDSNDLLKPRTVYVMKKTNVDDKNCLKIESRKNISGLIYPHRMVNKSLNEEINRKGTTSFNSEKQPDGRETAKANFDTAEVELQVDNEMFSLLDAFESTEGISKIFNFPNKDKCNKSTMGTINSIDKQLDSDVNDLGNQLTVNLISDTEETNNDVVEMADHLDHVYYKNASIKVKDRKVRQQLLRKRKLSNSIAKSDSLHTEVNKESSNDTNSSKRRKTRKAKSTKKDEKITEIDFIVINDKPNIEEAKIPEHVRHEIEILEYVFKYIPFPGSSYMHVLAKNLNVTWKSVNSWFIYRRSEAKKNGLIFRIKEFYNCRYCDPLSEITESAIKHLTSKSHIRNVKNIRILRMSMESKISDQSSPIIYIRDDKEIPVSLSDDLTIIENERKHNCNLNTIGDEFVKSNYDLTKKGKKVLSNDHLNTTENDVISNHDLTMAEKEIISNHDLTMAGKEVIDNDDLTKANEVIDNDDLTTANEVIDNDDLTTANEVISNDDLTTANEVISNDLTTTNRVIANDYLTTVENGAGLYSDLTTTANEEVILNDIITTRIEAAISNDLNKTGIETVISSDSTTTGNEAVISSDAITTGNEAVKFNDLATIENETIISNDLTTTEYEAVMFNDLATTENEAIKSNDLTTIENEVIKSDWGNDAYNYIPNKCTLCLSYFPNKWSLLKHSLTHRDIVCNLCNIAITHAEYKNHVTSHLIETDYEKISEYCACSECHKLDCECKTLDSLSINSHIQYCKCLLCCAMETDSERLLRSCSICNQLQCDCFHKSRNYSECQETNCKYEPRVASSSNKKINSGTKSLFKSILPSSDHLFQIWASIKEQEDSGKTDIIFPENITDSSFKLCDSKEIFSRREKKFHFRTSYNDTARILPIHNVTYDDDIGKIRIFEELSDRRSLKHVTRNGLQKMTEEQFYLFLEKDIKDTVEYNDQKTLFESNLADNGYTKKTMKSGNRDFENVLPLKKCIFYSNYFNDYCVICRAGPFSPKKLLIHTHVHCDVKKEFICNECGVHMVEFRDCIEHIFEHLNIACYVCHFCPQKFSKYLDIIKHSDIAHSFSDIDEISSYNWISSHETQLQSVSNEIVNNKSDGGVSFNYDKYLSVSQSKNITENADLADTPYENETSESILENSDDEILDVSEIPDNIEDMSGFFETVVLSDNL